ncbi:hypothetical protein N7536_002424 [Penicillium majusculum]|uniref:Uncharacterized protein n=1 Tax=Penicillium solitum TaxID=60172 RepID=A0A1V6QVA6_9EURO|nr:uncharacterized protein PENSOL_c034G09662 [Penicillium solitum]KAJ5699411.1 hypothetical protein N7536_002424 [Penicillium majusculum]OQD93149.1 hypothetical protein PENSOL_c034G09662 [Penicillium solitum]
MRFAIIASALALVAGANAALSPREVEPIPDLSEKLQESYNLIIQIATIVFPEKTASVDPFMTPFTTPNCRDGIPAVIKKNNYQLHGANVYEYTQFEKESICKCWGSYIEGYEKFLYALVQHKNLSRLGPFKATIGKLTLELKQAFDDISDPFVDGTLFCFYDANDKKRVLDKEFEEAANSYLRY